MGLGTCQTVQFGGGQIFKPPGFRHCFGFSGLIRKGTDLGTLDSESPQKGLSGDTHIFQFGPYPICTKNPPPHIFRTQCSKPLCLVTTMNFAKHLCGSYQVYCNSLPVLGGCISWDTYLLPVRINMSVPDSLQISVI